MYAVPSLEAGKAWAEETFGVAPMYGGEHLGLGTCNALLSLGDTYLEIIAPDPQQQLDGTLGERFAALKVGGLVTWAVQGDLQQVAQALRQAGVRLVGPNRTERQDASGQMLAWELLFPAGTLYGGSMPFFIDWLECEHPSSTSPTAGEVRALSVSETDANGLRGLLRAVGIDVPVSSGDPGLRLEISTSVGEVVLTSTAETASIRIA